MKTLYREPGFAYSTTILTGLRLHRPASHLVSAQAILQRRGITPQLCSKTSG